VAAVLHGSAYVTADFDFCYSRGKENLAKLAAAFVPFQLDATTLRSGSNFTLETDLGAVDILGEVSGLGSYEKLLPFSEELELYGMRCKVLTLEGLIKTKKASGRTKDLMLLPELEALLEIRNSQKKS